MNNVSTESREKVAQLAWTGFILSFFLIQAVIWTIAISVTMRDSSHAVVAGYDEQAIRWDETRAERRASVALGWTARWHIDQAADIRGNRVFTLTLSDRNQQPVENATWKLRAFHRGRAAEVQHLEPDEVASGVYSGVIRVQHAGNWQFTGSASRGPDTFLIEQRMPLSVERNR